MFLIYRPSFVNYDAQWALLWARDAWSGFLPEYTADFAPTPHPLATAVSSLALPFGGEADIAILWLTLLAFGALVYLTYRLGAELFNPWVGAVAALVVITRPVLLRDTLIGYQDLPFAALVVGAVLLEAQRHRRGVPVLVLLALAGLLRPEAWVLSGLYWLYLWPGATTRDRVRTAALAVSAPLIWAGTDWIVTGDPLHSLHGTAALAEEADRRRSPEDVPYWTAQYFGFALREPLLLGIPIGLAFAWAHARRRAALPLVAVGAMIAVFAAGPLFGLPLIRRYVDTPTVLLCLFYGLAVAGWTMLPRGRARTTWMVAGIVAGGLSIAYLPWHVPQLDKIDRRVQLDGVLYRHLAARDRGAARAGRLRAVRAAHHRRPPPDPLRALLARRRPRHGRHGGQRREPDGPDAAAAAARLVDPPHLQPPDVPGRRAARELRAHLPQPLVARLRRPRLRPAPLPGYDVLHRHGVVLLVVVADAEEVGVGLDRRRAARPTSASRPCPSRSPRRRASRRCRARG